MVTARSRKPIHALHPIFQNGVLGAAIETAYKCNENIAVCAIQVDHSCLNQVDIDIGIVDLSDHGPFCSVLRLISSSYRWREVSARM